jgi:polysaccharide pyruvyl transferase WcaK-like protein
VKALAYALELLGAVLLVPAAWLLRLAGWRSRHVTIVGWWGSETVGDIAILGQLLRELAAVSSDAPAQVVSFDAAETRRSLAMLKASDVPVLPLGLGSAWSLVSARALVFGGGPLMESPSLPLWALRATVARLAGARVVLYGNGIGPLRTMNTRHAVATLLRRSTQVALRDSTSVTWARERAPDVDIVQTFDPAYDYVRSELELFVERRPVLALALRTPPATYLGSGDAQMATETFLVAVAAALDEIMDRQPIELHGIVMHTGHADSDDHALYQMLRSRLRHPDRLHVPPGVHGVDDAIAAMQRARAVLTVRFHAMIFALATETPFVAIDYARPDGKVSASAADAGRSGDVISWDDVDAPRLVDRLSRALSSAPITAPDLKAAGACRLRLLREALD